MPFNNLRVIRNAIELILGFGDAKATLYFLTLAYGSAFFVGEAKNYESCSSARAERRARKVASISC
jgi:hypothetical protein